LNAKNRKQEKKESWKGIQAREGKQVEKSEEKGV